MDLSGIRHSSNLHSTKQQHRNGKDIISNKPAPKPEPASPPGPAAAASAGSGPVPRNCSQHSIKNIIKNKPEPEPAAPPGLLKPAVSAAAAAGGGNRSAAAAGVGTIYGAAAEPVLGANDGHAACRHSMQAHKHSVPVWRPDYAGAAFQPAQAARMSHVYQSSLYTPPATKLSSPGAVMGNHDHQQEQQGVGVEAFAAFVGEAEAQEEHNRWPQPQQQQQQQGRQDGGLKEVNHHQQQDQQQQGKGLGSFTVPVPDVPSAVRKSSAIAGRSHGAAAVSPIPLLTPDGSDIRTNAASAAAAATCGAAKAALVKCSSISSSDSRGSGNGFRTVSSNSSRKLAAAAAGASSSSSSSSNHSSSSMAGLAAVNSTILRQLPSNTHSAAAAGPSDSDSAAAAARQGSNSTQRSYAVTRCTPKPLSCPDPTPSDSPVLSRSKAKPRCRPSMVTSSLPPRAPLSSSASAFSPAVAAAPTTAPAMAASMLLTPSPNFDKATTATKFDQPNRNVSRVDLHPRSRSMCIDQADYELQQLTYWWLVVDQVVDQLHGEGMKLQEQLEKLVQQQQKLEQMLHGMDQLRPVDINNHNMKAARYKWGALLVS